MQGSEPFATWRDQSGIQLPQLTSRSTPPAYADPLTQQRGSQRRFLTEPSKGAGNQGWDNENSDLVLAVEDVLQHSREGRRYVVKDLLGQGTFGQVVKCICEDTGEAVAVKVIKNQTAFYHQARVEVGVLQYLNNRGDAEDRHHIVRMRDFFVFRNHLCLVFELMSVNLYELVKHNRFKGLSLTLLRVFIAQILDALTVLRESNIIHCDLKPENVLLKSLDSGDVKVIDFGSACFENKTMYSYIQSRFYRSPEVLMGHPYNVAIDMWSLGCMAAELFLGLPLFPGASEHDLLVRIVEMMGVLPGKVLQKAQHTSKYFRKIEEPGRPINGVQRTVVRYQLRSQAEFEALHGQQAPAGKRYFQHTKLADIIGAYPYKAGLSDEDMAKESERREAFLDFLMGVLDLDPSTRWSPRQALQHPFITNQTFRGPFQPSPDPHMPIRGPAFQPGSAPAGSPCGLAVSPYNTMMATSPEAHAQAHAAALAAVNAHFSPRAAQQIPSHPRHPPLVNEAPSPMSSSLPGQAYSTGAPSSYRRGMIPTPPNNQQHFPVGTPPQLGGGGSGGLGGGGSGGLSGGLEGMQWSQHQLLPQYSSGPVPMSPVGSASLLRSGSLAAVLAPWTTQQGAPPLSQPVGSLEALRATWRAPHNSYGSGPYGIMRSGRMGSGNLGARTPMALNSLSQAVDIGLPPLPSSSSLQADGRLQSVASGQLPAQDFPRSYQRRTSGDGTSANLQGAGSYKSVAGVQQAVPSMPEDYAASLLSAGPPSRPRPQPSSSGFPPPNALQQAQPGRRDTSELGAQVPLPPEPFELPAPPPGSFTRGSAPLLPGSYGSSSTLPSFLSQPEGLQQQPGGPSSLVDFASGLSKGSLAWQQEALQQQHFSGAASGEYEPAEPSDWDPLYSDEQLLNEEQAWRSGDGAGGGQSADADIRLRPHSAFLGLSEQQAGGRAGRPGAFPQQQAQSWQQGMNTAYDGLRALHQAQGGDSREAPSNQLDFRQHPDAGGALPGGPTLAQSSLQQPSLLTSQMAQSPGSFPGGFSTWQHPSLSASLYTLPEVAPAYQDPGLGNNTPLPAYTQAGLKSQPG